MKELGGRAHDIFRRVSFYPVLEAICQNVSRMNFILREDLSVAVSLELQMLVATHDVLPQNPNGHRIRPALFEEAA